MYKNIRLVEKDLSKKGYKATKQRKEILKAIYENEMHVTIAEIFAKVKNKKVGLSTVYRTVDLLKAVGVIKEISLGNKTFYEPRKYKTKKFHIHFICKKCGKVIDIDDNIVLNNVINLNLELQKIHDINIKDTNIVLYGLCSKCTKNN